MTTFAPSYAPARALLAMKVLALEFDAGSSNQNATRSFLPRILKSVSDGLRTMISEKTDFYKAAAQSITAETVMQKVSGVEWEKVADTEVTLLEGFHGNLLAYIDTVKAGYDYYEAHTGKEIARLRKLVAQVISLKSARTLLSDETGHAQQLAAERAKLEADIATFFQVSSYEARVVLGNVVSDANNLKSVFEQNQLLIQLLKTHSFDNVKKDVAQLKMMVDELVDSITKEEITDVSRSQINNLSTGLIEVAYQLEFFALTSYRAATISAACERVGDTLMQAF